MFFGWASKLKDQCGICNRVLRTRYLRRCTRCGKLYCRDCMVEDVATGDPTRMVCLNCARRIVSPSTITKYDGLARYLKFRGSFTDTVQLSFARIDGLIGDNLPMEAYKNERWWENSPYNEHAKAWLNAGWETREVNLKEGYVTFKRVRHVQTKKKRDTQTKKPFTPARVRPMKPKTPSKTKISKLYARIKNLERRRMEMPTYKGSFKPKPQHEKTLFKSKEKPQ